MKFSKVTQFWDWFTRHSESYMQLETKSKAESQYLLCEMHMHLLPFGKDIHAELYHAVDASSPNSMFIFSANGRSQMFLRIERLVAKAPVLPGWTFIGLHPPMQADHGFARDYPQLNIDPFTISFEPPTQKDEKGRFYLTVYIEMYNDPTEEFEHAVRTAVYNVLGEKTYGLGIYLVYVENLFHLPQRKREKLVNISKLPEYIQVSADTLFVINQLGQVVQRK